MAVKSKGFLTSITKLFNGKYQVVFEMEKPLDHKSDELLNIEVKKYRKGRSLNANAYFHELNDKLAEVLSNSRTAQKNILLGRYGTLERGMSMLLFDDIPYLELDYIHLHPTVNIKTNKDGKVCRQYQIIKHTTEYNTKEMSRLINGTVDECKQVGIETLTPDELHRMKGYE